MKINTVLLKRKYQCSMQFGQENNYQGGIMKPGKINVKIFITFLVLYISIFSCYNESSIKLQKSVIGDYLFEYKEMNFVGLITVYEEDGNLLAFSELADYPVEMKLKDAETSEYKIKFKKSGYFTLKFSNKNKGVFTQIKFAGDKNDFEMIGKRFDRQILKLRDYHNNKTKNYSYLKPLALEDDWEVSTLQEAGIDTAAIYDIMNVVLDKYDYMHSILIIKNGKLIFEEYLNGWDPIRIHRLQSVTKSVTSTLVGIAIREGFIENINDPVFKDLPEYDSLFNDAKKRISIKHLLTMSAGFEWNEGATYYVDPKNCDSHLADASGDYIKYVLDKPLVHEPGKVYYYNSGYPNILGYIIENTSGMNITEFSYKYLFDSLGIKRSYWMPIIGEDRPGCAGGLRLMSRDLARYGYLYLNDGVWQENQIVQKEWVKASIEGKLDTGEGTRYGYLWKTIKTLDNKHNIFFASGTGGQYVVCIPDLAVVIVTTAKPFTDKGDELAMLLLEKLIPAL